MDAPVGVLIVDDDYYAREALRNLVAKDRRTRVWDVAEGVDSAAALPAARGRGPLPAVLLLDVRLGEAERGGIDGIAMLRQAFPTARILITSVSRDESTVLAAVHAGADGYVWKNESTHGIVDAICGVAEGRFVVTPSVAERMLGATADLGAYAAEVLPEEPAWRDLTDSIRKTLYLYCLCGMSAREIADELQVSVNTVNSRIKVAYQALAAGTRQEAFQRLVERHEAAR